MALSEMFDQIAFYNVLTYFIAASRLHRKLRIRVFEASSAVNGQTCSKFKFCTE